MEPAAEPPLALPVEDHRPANPQSQRAEETRRELVEQHGGSAETEEAVRRALDWLARHQERDGHWASREYDQRCGACAGPARVNVDVAVTGLALLTFLATDNTHERPGPFRDTVARAIDWLVARQDRRGAMIEAESMYSHGIATIALAESYGMTADPRLEEPVRRAAAFIIDSRNREVGGWRYAPRQVGDTSVMGWQIMALMSAQKAGVDVDPAGLAAGRDWLELVRSSRSFGTYAYQPGREVTPAMTAEAMFVRQLLGAAPDDDLQRASAAYLLSHPPGRGDEDGNSYYWYYATFALFQHQGEAWAQWNERVREILVERQQTTGRAAGSWDPYDRWAAIGGRVYQTAISTLTLEVYYRYLPSFAVAENGRAAPATIVPRE
jgi:hypothetical protein